MDGHLVILTMRTRNGAHLNGVAERKAEENGRKDVLGSPYLNVIDQMREDTVSDSMMNRYLQEEGLLPKQAEAGAV